MGPGDQQVDGAWSSRRIQRLGPGFQVIRRYSALTANINAIAEANTAAAARPAAPEARATSSTPRSREMTNAYVRNAAKPRPEF